MNAASKRVPKMTVKAQEERLHHLLGTRRAKLGHLTRQMREIEALLEDSGNVDTVYDCINGEFAQSFAAFQDINYATREFMSDDEAYLDQLHWFEPKSQAVKHFVDKVKDWVEKVKLQSKEAEQCDAEVECNDSASMVISSSQLPLFPKKSRSQVASGVSSTASSRLKIETERAELLARANALLQKQELEREETELKAKRENLELQTAIAAAEAKLQVLSMYEPARSVSDASGNAARAATIAETLKATPNQVVRPKTFSRELAPDTDAVPRDSDVHHDFAKSQPTRSDVRIPSHVDTGSLFNIMQRQNDIAEIFMKQQSLSTLPPMDIPVFSGDPLDFTFFIRAFEHGVESKTTNNKDRLYFLEQFTKGQPKVLVRSCQHMPSERGYKEAKRLLYQHFGNEYTIATAYTEKALNWPALRPEDNKALNEFALFLTGCCNTIDSVEYVEEMDSPSNMRAIVSKLPFKLREKWRAVACELQERTGLRARFCDLVSFVDKQAKIVSHPLFGNIQDNTMAKDNLKFKTNRSSNLQVKERKTTFATSVTPVPEPKKQRTMEKDLAKASHETLCLCCNKNHGLDVCSILKHKPHNEKLDFLKSKGLCYGCLLPGHMSKGCVQRLTCQKCSLKHPTILHLPDRKPVLPKSQDGDSSLTVTDTVISETCGCTGAGHLVCSLAIVPVRVKSKKSNQEVLTYAFLDPGSSATFCTEQLMKELKLTGRKTNILLRTMGQERSVSTHVCTELEISGLNENNFVDLPQVFSQKEIPVKGENIPQQKDVQKWKYLEEVHLPQIDAGIGLLIGTNVPKILEPWKVINSRGDGPYAVKTILGWIVNGPLERENIQTNRNTGWTQVMANRISVVTLENLIQQQMRYDFPECEQAENLEMSIEDRQFMKSVSQSIKLVDGHYCIDLPLKKKDVMFPNNYVVASLRSQFLKRKFKRNSAFYMDYCSFMEDMLLKGHAEKIPASEIEGTLGRIWYIPHHGVYHPQKHKLRVVFDCAATYQGKSLNSQLLQGPNLNNSLIGVLVRFRHKPIALAADVEGMFHQVRVPAKDKDLLRFLWWPKGDTAQEVEEYRMSVHLFGATSSPSCAIYALQRCAKDNSAQHRSEVIQTVLRNFYVDDCLSSVATEQQGIALMHDLREMCASGGFNLTKWMSNSRTVLASISEESKAKTVKDLDLEKDKLPLERALGVQWCVETDTLQFKVTLQEKPLTRRGILSMVSSIYDPLGILSPVILPAKQILQELCRTKHDWDDKIPETLRHQWNLWLASLQNLNDFQVERCMKPLNFGEITSAQLHHFADASELGFGTVSYLLMENHRGNQHCAFVMGKARVAPVKTVTVPRLELTAATMAARMDNMLKSELDLILQESVFWTDSTSVLKYLNNESTRFRTFVTNRVTAIRELSKASQWRYVNSSSNPADIASRGLTVDAFLKANSWLTGPSFLTKPESEWPKMPSYTLKLSVNDLEVKEVCVNAVSADNSDYTSQFFSHYSDWYRLKRAIAWFLKFKSTLKTLMEKRNELCHSLRDNLAVNSELQNFKSSLSGVTLTVSDLEKAEEEIIRYSQTIMFPEEIKALQQGKTVKHSSALYKLSPVLQDKILRVGGRLSRSSMPEEAKHPAILAKDHPVSHLILRSIHADVGHSGRNHMLSKLREKYWIPKAQTAIRKILSQCTICKRQRGTTGKQFMADLPRDRLLPDEPPFTNVGIDYFGPFEIKRGRTLIKRYGVIFTCLTLRAVHIEVASSLDTDSCIHALRRFVSRRGQVKTIRSDNGTNFIGAERELQKAIQSLNNDRIQTTMLAKGVQWIFNAPTASHHGGVWERQIRTVRKILNSIVKQQSLDEESLQTLLCEVEAIINSRPITKVSNDPNDLEALTPNHLLLLKVKPPMSPGVFDKADLYSRRRWRQVQYMADIFWKRWIKEYLPDLQERQKWQSLVQNLKPGDVVLVADDSAPRNSWVMGRVLQTFTDNKGLVRQARVKTSTNILLRPVTKLCLLLEADL